MDTKARHIVKNLYKFYKCHHNCLKLLKWRFVHNMNPSFSSVWVYNLTNGIPGNSTDVQLAYSWTEHTDHIKDLLVSQHKERSRLETEIQQIPVKHTGVGLSLQYLEHLLLRAKHREKTNLQSWLYRSLFGLGSAPLETSQSFLPSVPGDKAAKAFTLHNVSVHNIVQIKKVPLSKGCEVKGLLRIQI